MTTATATHKLAIVDSALADGTEPEPGKRLITEPDEAVSRLLDGEAVWVPGTLLPAVKRTLAMVMRTVQTGNPLGA